MFCAYLTSYTKWRIFGITVTAWARKPLMLNGIGYGRVSGKDGGTNQLAPAASGISYVVALGLGHLLM